MEGFNWGNRASGGLVRIFGEMGRIWMQVFVVECGECGRFRGEILGGLGRWLLGECGGEVWETSGGCGDGFSVEKVVLEVMGAEGFERQFLVNQWCFLGLEGARGRWLFWVSRCKCMWSFWSGKFGFDLLLFSLI